MRNSWSKYALKVLWLIGFIALIFVSDHFEKSIAQVVATSFNMEGLIWYKAVAPVLIGIYISFLLRGKWSFKMNVPMLLCVTIPCLVLTFYLPSAFTITSLLAANPNSFSVPFPNWMFGLNSSIFPSTIAAVGGLTLMMGLLTTVALSPYQATSKKVLASEREPKIL